MGVLLAALLVAAPSAFARDRAWLHISGGTIDFGSCVNGLRIRDGAVEMHRRPESVDPYVYALRVGDGPFRREVPRLRSQSASLVTGGAKVLLSVKAGPLSVRHEFFAMDVAGGVEETISITNEGRETVTGIDFGFERRIGRFEDGAFLPEGTPVRASAIPWGRSAMNPAPGYPYYEAASLVKGMDLEPEGVRALGSEAWGFEEDHSLLVSKLSTSAVEFSVLRLERRGSDILMRTGGAASWLGFPESVGSLAPGEKVELGVTRYAWTTGGWKEAFREYRRSMGTLDSKRLSGYSPPVFWNEIFDNPMLGQGDTPELRRRHYDRKRIDGEARKAAEYGAEGLYLDPGWDTAIGSAIWAEDRLGPLKDFVVRMRKDYGFPIGLHTPLPSMADPASHPESSRRLVNGRRQATLCAGSKQYQAEQGRRLDVLARAGVAFVMFDGTRYLGDCEDPAHGHPVPYTREAHIRAVLSLLQAFKRAHPKVLVELHDPLNGGQLFRLTPMYLLYDRPHSFDEAWASEFMLDPLKYLLEGPARGLYYYNVAHTIPLYEHIDLRKDTEGGLAFWWYASTCRHLGFGGTHTDRKVREAQKKAVRRYRELGKFFKSGGFFGLAEDIHAHTLEKEKESVLVVFNFDKEPAKKSFEVEPSAIRLGLGAKLEGATEADRRWVKAKGGGVAIEAEVPALGAAVIRLKAR